MLQPLKLLITGTTTKKENNIEELYTYIEKLFPKELVDFSLSSSYSNYLGILIAYKALSESYTVEDFVYACESLELYLTKNRFEQNSSISFVYL